MVAWWESTCEAAYIAKKSCNCGGFKCVGCPSLAPCCPFIWHILFSHGHVASHRGLAVPLQLCKLCSSPEVSWSVSWHGKGKQKRIRLFSSVSHPCWVQLAGKGRAGLRQWGMAIVQPKCCSHSEWWGHGVRARQPAELLLAQTFLCTASDAFAICVCFYQNECGWFIM